jgi:hypothetical protein
LVGCHVQLFIPGSNGFLQDWLCGQLVRLGDHSVDIIHCAKQMAVPISIIQAAIRVASVQD